ncbi:nitroreductase family protein [Desulforhopalus sp. 52FAK]
MSLLTIDRERCKQDELCVMVCPARIIQMDENNYPVLMDDADERCINCGHCVAICPAGCIDHREMRATDCLPLRKELSVSSEQNEQLFKGRRSIRQYKKRQVERADVEALLDLARYSPSGHNSGGVNWLVIADSDELQKLKEAVAGWMEYMLTNMKEFALSLHLDVTLESWKKGEDVILRDAPMVIVAYAEKESRMAPASCTIALSHLELAASARGLGACWAGYFNAAANAYPPMQDLLNLPDGHSSYGAMMLGYPQLSYARIPKRKDANIEWRL